MRYVRDGLCATCEHHVDRLQRLGDAGIKSHIIAGDLRDGSAEMQENLGVLRTRLKDAVASIGAPNEPDLSGDPNWVSNTRAYQRELWTRVKGDPVLKDVPVLGPGGGAGPLRGRPGRPLGLPRQGQHPSVPRRGHPAAQHHQRASRRLPGIRRQAACGNRDRLPLGPDHHQRASSDLRARDRLLHAAHRAGGLSQRGRAQLRLPAARPLVTRRGGRPRLLEDGELLRPAALGPVRASQAFSGSGI